MIERREREGEREKERYREGGRDKRERERERCKGQRDERDRERESERGGKILVKYPKLRNKAQTKVDYTKMLLAIIFQNYQLVYYVTQK